MDKSENLAETLCNFQIHLFLTKKPMVICHTRQLTDLLLIYSTIFPDS